MSERLVRVKLYLPQRLSQIKDNRFKNCLGKFVRCSVRFNWFHVDIRKSNVLWYLLILKNFSPTNPVKFRQSHQANRKLNKLYHFTLQLICLNLRQFKIRLQLSKYQNFMALTRYVSFSLLVDVRKYCRR